MYCVRSFASFAWLTFCLSVCPCPSTAFSTDDRGFRFTDGEGIYIDNIKDHLGIAGDGAYTVAIDFMMEQ